MAAWGVRKVCFARRWLWKLVLTAGSRLLDLLPPVFATLRRHPRPSVRLAVARSSHALLTSCSDSLADIAPVWLESLLVLAQDPWPQVAESAISLLGTFHVIEDDEEAPAGLRRLGWPFVYTLLNRHAAELGSAQSESEATVTSRLLAGLLAFAGPVRVAERVIAVHATRQLLVSGLLRLYSVAPQASQVALSDLANHAALSDSATDYPLYPCRHPDFSFLRTDEVRLCLTHDTKSTDDRRGPHAGLRHRRVHSAPPGPSKRSCKYALSLCTRWYVHRHVTAPCLTNTPSEEALETFRTCVAGKTGLWRREASSAALLLCDLVFGASSASPTQSVHSFHPAWCVGAALETAVLTLRSQARTAPHERDNSALRTGCGVDQ